ncbi:MAG: hypothetical protein E7378_04665 [Clostridiales bacterium]|nr:hypothetical protein [Clostridiales bacterium]
MSGFNREDLEKLGIYELRARARLAGVKSPTSKKHGELVDAIIQIQNGEVEAVSSNKGRKPKNSYMELYQKTLTIDEDEQTLDYMPEDNFVFELRDGNCCVGVCLNPRKCRGVVRELEGKLYLYTYGTNGVNYALISDNVLATHNIKKGDYIVGELNEYQPNCYILQTVHSINFKNEDYAATETTSQIVKFDKIQEAYEQIANANNNNNKLNIVLELETDHNLAKAFANNSVYLYSKSMDSLRKSYNTLMDAVNLVKNLKQQQTPYVLHIIDPDYIFSILMVLAKDKTGIIEKEAGIFFKDLLFACSTSNHSSWVAYRKQAYTTNPYLNAILAKYI